MYCCESKQYALEYFRVLSETPVENVIWAQYLSLERWVVYLKGDGNKNRKPVTGNEGNVVL